MRLLPHLYWNRFFFMPYTNPLHQQFADAKLLIQAVGRGEIVCCGLSGPAGQGKTRLVEETLTAMGVEYRLFNGSRAALIGQAYELRDGGVLLVDDADSLILEGGLAGVNLLKSLLLPKPVRHVVNDSIPARRGDPGFAPARFDTRVCIIVCSNIDLDNVPPKMRPHMDALIDRGLRFVRLSTDRLDHLDYVLDLIINHDLLRSRGVSLRQVQEIVDWLCRRVYLLRTISVRRAIDAADLQRRHQADWRRFADLDLLPEPVSFKALLLPPFVVPASKREISRIGSDKSRVRHEQRLVQRERRAAKG